MATTGSSILITWLKKRATTGGKALSLQTLFCGMIAVLVISCGSSGQTAQAQNSHSQGSQVSPDATVAPLTAVDWANFTYFSSCYGNTQAFHTRNGQATNGHVHFYVYPPTYGNLTGHQQLDAVVPYQCSAADASGVHAFVYSGSALHPILIGQLPLPDSRGTIENITSIKISNGILQLTGTGYSANAPHCCPDLLIRTSYKWQGTSFAIVQTSVSKK